MAKITREFLEQKAQELNDNGIKAEFYEYEEDDWEGQNIFIGLEWYKDGLVHDIDVSPEDGTGLYLEGVEGKLKQQEYVSGVEDGRLYYLYFNTGQNEPMRREYFASIPGGYYEEPYSTIDETPTTKAK